MFTCIHSSFYRNNFLNSKFENVEFLLLEQSVFFVCACASGILLMLRRCYAFVPMLLAHFEEGVVYRNSGLYIGGDREKVFSRDSLGGRCDGYPPAEIAVWREIGARLTTNPKNILKCEEIQTHAYFNSPSGSWP